MVWTWWSPRQVNCSKSVCCERYESLEGSFPYPIAYSISFWNRLFHIQLGVFWICKFICKSIGKWPFQAFEERWMYWFYVWYLAQCYSRHQKERIHFFSSRIFKTEECQMDIRECATPTIQLVQTGPSLMSRIQRNGYIPTKTVKKPSLRNLPREVATYFLFLCRHLSVFKNDPWSSYSLN